MDIKEADRAEHRWRIAVASAELAAQRNPGDKTRAEVEEARRRHAVALARRRIVRAVAGLTAEDRAELAELLLSA